ncbi:MAG TPA: AAA family ATPase [Aliidongia sp.]|uniref:AAA family ATPase n=1 Tax=Aliidongia sp. TaxID=1914230 RepID=UPI002DDCE74F|nr:AAA family ATPase [Aliidongia sp.]HEV2676358.1 AAA family ATPase [Aliidongia sp.]
MQAAPETEQLEEAAPRESFAAFLADDASVQQVRQCIAEMGLPPSCVHRGDISTAINYLEKVRSPRALMVDIAGAEPALTKIQHLADVCEPGVSVVAVGDRNDVGLYRDLLGVGISDYIVKPLPAYLIHKAMNGLLGLAEVANTPLSHKLGKIITVVGTRGGVGASTLATNLAWGLANRKHRRVALVDLDLKYGACGLMLGVKSDSGLREALERPVRVDELFVRRAMIPCGERLFLLACQEKVNDPIVVDPLALSQLVSILRKEFHFVVLDAARENSTLLAQALELASTRIVVVDQTTLSVRDMLGMREAYRLGQDDSRNMMVLNRFGESGKAGIAAKEMEEVVGLRFDSIVPFDAKSVVFAANAGVPLLNRRGPAAKAIEQLAEKLGGHAPLSRKRWWQIFRK